jgi:predicted NAD-dependent protein-ADP-ribosyltransferase YbiA (DUF1768 family)
MRRISSVSAFECKLHPSYNAQEDAYKPQKTISLAAHSAMADIEGARQPLSLRSLGRQGGDFDSRPLWNSALK